MKAKIAYSTATGIDKIIKDLKAQIGTFDSKLIQFFASSNFDPYEISKRLSDTFGETPIFGCTTAGELVSGQMLENSVVLMAFGPEIVADCSIAVLEDITSDNMQIEKAFDAFKDHFKQDMAALDPHKYVGFLLIDGLCGIEEKINERIGDLTNVTFVGGSAGDDAKFKQTHVFANGKAYTNAAVLAIVKSNTQFGFIKTQSFKSTDKKIVITKVVNDRTASEINNNAAVKEYARLTGTSEYNADKMFMKHPLGLAFENDFFVHSPRNISSKGLTFYSSIIEGMQYEILEAQNIVKETRKIIDKKLEEMGTVSALVCYNCILRKYELKNENQIEAYAQIFLNTPTIGFNTYGESYIGHINQTAVMVLFK